MESFGHYENFSYDEEKGDFLVEVPVPPGRGKIPRATPAILKDHLEVDIKVTRGGNCSTRQPSRPLEECYSWWLAQLIHYGLCLELSADEAKQVVKSAIVSGALKVPAHLRKMEQSMRNAANRRAKQREQRVSGKKPISAERRKNIKVESVTSDSEDDNDTVQTAVGQTRVLSQAKLDMDTSSDNDSVRELDSFDPETDSDTIKEEVPLSWSTMNPTGRIARKETATIKVQTRQPSGVTASVRNPSTERPNDKSSSESDDGEPQDILQDAIRTERDQDSSETDGDSEGCRIKPVSTNAQPDSEDPVEGNADGGSFSGDSEYERAVMYHSLAVDGASHKYGNIDINNSSESSSDDEGKIQSTWQPLMRKAQPSLRATYNPPKSSIGSAASISTSIQPASPRELKIRRDRKPRPEELERASTHETTPSHTPKKRLRHDHQRADSTDTVNEATATADVHPGMTYDDIRDPIARRTIARMRSVFPKETIHTCYACLAKHNGDYDKGCEELVNITSVLAAEKPAPVTDQHAQTTSAGQKRKISSLTKQETAQYSSRGKRQDLFPLSDSNEPILKQAIISKRRKASSLENRTAIISDDMHGSQIDLTGPDSAEISDEIESDLPAKKYSRKRPNHRKSANTDSSSPKTLHTVWVDIPSLPAAKSHRANESESQKTFPSSPFIGVGLKGILKSSPSFRPRDTLLSKAQNSAVPLSTQSRTMSLVLPPRPHRSKADPDLSLQPLLRKSQQKAPLQNQGSWNSYATESGWQVLNPKSKSIMRPSGQIEEETQQETRQTLLPSDKKRVVGLSRQDGGGLLQRGIARNPSASSSTSTTKKYREKGFGEGNIEERY